MKPTGSHHALYWYLVVNLPRRTQARDFMPVLTAAVAEFKAGRAAAQCRRRTVPAPRAGRFRVIQGGG